jgi:bifunctional UDP-N-acetylglucosamine pyrophosphorylase / glucosamine-1-phosphate N-acetyltransferase
MSTRHLSERVRQLLDRGVRMPQPDSVFVDESVKPDRIAADAVLHPGTRLQGAALSVGSGCVLGEETPVTVEDCQLGRGVRLKGGYVCGATFLDGSSLGSAAHVRPGTLIEEEAGGAHAVGFKQTILFPFVVTGSLVNFCDVLMSGGTGRKDHSEVGSSYVHFNFTPHQDKATASLIGDVPRGVMLDRRPVFLGGQGGLVGPARIAFGCLVPAGVVYRHDALHEGMILHPRVRDGAESVPYQAGVYRSFDRILRNNLIYIGNLHALSAWYRHVRTGFLSGDVAGKACLEGALGQLALALAERLHRLDELVGRLPRSAALLREEGASASAALAARQDSFAARWAAVRSGLAQDAAESDGGAQRDAFLEQLGRGRGEGYVATIRELDPASRALGTAWLKSIVDRVSAAGTPGGEGG